ncbi:NAD(P)/FAD-dependent oxidoreductase, partial [Candidatus Micrarchaeota archaeon]|nr:NAD(P)/FAD-dependent oxidoreductase [Candidatus Micrarchaeota archaeon]MBU1930856.1 NAD(P)/FAD-dependent oxidoreductase [Candidatus Micrarchaeota archaeon]
LHACQNRLKTAVLEEHQAIGEPVHCGECLSKLAIDRQNLKLPEKVISETVKGVRILFPNNQSIKLTEPGFVLEKHLFEQWLGKKAEQAGAEILLDHKVLDLKREKGLWELKTNHGEIKSKIVIDASGVQSIVNQKLELNPRFESVIGVQFELKDIPRDGYLDFHLWPHRAPNGYCWMIPKSNGRANVGLVTNQKNKAKALCTEFVRQKGWEQKEIVKTFGGLIPASGPLPTTVSDGLMLVGDAAGFTSPMFEGGTQLGLQSGKFAAQVATQAIKENKWEKNKLQEYEHLWKKEFPRYGVLTKGKKALYAFSNEELNKIASVLPSELNELKWKEKLIVGWRILRHHPGLYRKSVLQAFKAFGYSQAKYYGW